MLSGQCPKCQSERIVKSAELLGREPVVVAIRKDPGALLSRELFRSELTAAVCGDCGHTELFTPFHRELYEASKRQIG